METIAEAKEYLRVNWVKGVFCPCCNQRVQKYPININSSLAAALIALHRLTTENENLFYHVAEITKTANLKSSCAKNFSILKHWELIVEKPKNEIVDSHKRTSGFWSITDLGKDFASGKVTVKSHCWLYNKRCWGFLGEDVLIKQCLGEKFNWEELMQYTRIGGGEFDEDCSSAPSH